MTVITDQPQGEEPTGQTADELILERLNTLFDELATQVNEINEDIPMNDTTLQVQSLTFTFEGESRRHLVEECEQLTGTKSELFQPGINPTFSQGIVKIAFK